MSSPQEKTNPQLASEAQKTSDCERQQELAKHSSAVVRWHLAQNRQLCPAAVEILGSDEIARLRKMTREDVLNNTD